MIRTAKVTVTTTGDDGQATGTGYSSAPINGEVKAVRVDWGATAPGTSDIDVVAESDDDHPELTLYSKDDSAADAWVYPVVQSTDTGGSGVANVYQHIVVAGQRVKVSVAQSNALAPAVTVTVYYEEYR
jgi:hypothetical protein